MSGTMNERRRSWIALTVLGAFAWIGCSAGGQGDGRVVAGDASGGNGGASSSSGGNPGSGGGDGSGGTPGAGGLQAGSGGAAATGGTPGSGGATACVPGGGAQGSSRAKIRTVAYLPTYRGALRTWASELDFQKVSYVNIAFADVNGSGDLTLADTGICEFVNAAHAQGVKVCVAIGGYATINDPGVFGPLMQPANRAGFVQKIADYLDAKNFDCFDVDLEGAGITDDYTGFISELAAKLRPQGKELTAAVARWFDKPALTNALGYFDFLNIMAYDLCPFWESTPCEHSSIAAMNIELGHWVNTRGIEESKLLVGVPFYGYRWQAGNTGEALMYNQIVQSYPAGAQNDWVESGGATIVHNGIPTMRQKAELARGYGGIMIWEIAQDVAGANSLLGAIDGAL